jgi:hypothetical protein
MARNCGSLGLQSGRLFAGMYFLGINGGDYSFTNQEVQFSVTSDYQVGTGLDV